MQKKRIPILLSLAFICSGILAITSIYRLQGNARVINYAGVVRGATQRLIKQELLHRPNDDLIEQLDGIIAELMTGEGENNLIKLDSRDFQACMAAQREKWEDIKNEISDVRAGENSAHLFESSEEYFTLANDTVAAAEKYSERVVQQAAIGLLVLTVICVAAALITAWFTAAQNKRQLALKKAEDENRRKSEYLSTMSKQLQAPMNDISELLYVADIENYDLLFLNEAGQRNFHVNEFQPGMKCYKVLQGMDAPCPFCTNHLLREGEIYTWEYTNPIIGRHYLLKDRLIEWDGRNARMEIAFDTTESENEKIQLKYMLDAEKMVMECVRTLYQEHDFAVAVSQVLAHLGIFLSAERSYILNIRDDLLYNDYEWCADHVAPQKDFLQAVPLSLMERWYPYFETKGCVEIENIELIRESSPAEYHVLKEQDIKSLVVAPLEHDGKLEGCIGVDNPPADKMQNIGPLLQTLCYFLLLAKRRSENETQLSLLSYHDMLTSFYNRNRYIKDVEALKESRHPVGIIYLDINGLKDINDRHGHAFGDQILAESANRMKQVFEHGQFYRIGGDEFVIICQHMPRDQFEYSVRKLRLSFQRDELIHAAIGAKWAEEYEDIQHLISDADAKMYEDKKEYYRKHSTSNRYRHHSDEVLRLADPHVLQQEIHSNHFVVYLQPKVSSSDYTMVGAEALIRYQPKEESLLMPASFLPLLEETQLISKLDFYVFEFVCARISSWADQSKILFPVSVNFSRFSLAQLSFVEHLTDICKKYGVSPGLLEIEVTESVCEVEGIDISVLTSELQRAGFNVALDDFGTEYANLELLSSVAFDVLKLDKSMVSNLTDNKRAQSIVKSIVELCAKLGTRVVAEGIESEEQLALLKSCGVEVMQGFYFSRPIPAEEYESQYVKDTPGD
ncbi:bifunctional diguanylate cyclase/phosphodiesterase [Ruminococcus sp. OA3]|uniref:sensor domain-containing phosphodiesterase n=1 Tax=Ruminococcus sp. OA3 TaxID=2914164 RepID=UPI001F067120|nr:bifunctional diguanylate cyclase/phosphodiesterase [Ruminococcus sp. OA3]MCH1983298.1 bifunctional diguanylate cyclase/phosphodiesterase [Ruminococcus sp. OA3]